VALFELFEARVETVELFAQLIDAAQKVFSLRARYQITALVRQILGNVLGRGPRGAASPGARRTQSRHCDVRRAAAKKAGHTRFQVGPQQHAELAELLCDFSVAFDPDITARDDGLRVRAGECEQ
jgi:hypothetical protein